MSHSKAIEEAAFDVLKFFKDDVWARFDRDDDGRSFEARIATVRNEIEDEEGAGDIYEVLRTALLDRLEEHGYTPMMSKDVKACTDKMWDLMADYVIGVLEDTNDLYFENPFAQERDPVVLQRMTKVAIFIGQPHGSDGIDGTANARFFVRSINMETIRNDGEADFIGVMSPGPWVIAEAGENDFSGAMSPGPWVIEDAAENDFELALLSSDESGRHVIAFAPAASREMLQHVVDRSREFVPTPTSPTPRP